MTRNNNPGQFYDAFDTLLFHVVEHFAHEEAILRSYNYVAVNEHAKLHEKLVDTARRLRQEAVVSGISIGELVNFFASQIVAGHMLNEDSKFYGLFQNQGN